MSFSAIQTYFDTILSFVPSSHWVGMVLLSLTVILILWKKYHAYGAIAQGFAVFVSLFIIETAVVIRVCGFMNHSASGLNLAAEFDRLIHIDEQRRIEIFSNIAVFVPLGFFLSEFLSTIKLSSVSRRFGHVALATFGLSFCVECLQLILHVGFFELTDMVLNTFGGIIGAALSMSGRWIIALCKKEGKERFRQLFGFILHTFTY